MSDNNIIKLYLSMTDFGKNLTAIRKSRQLTQLELANLLDAQPRMIGRWEQGESKPQFDYIIQLAQLLEVSIDYLLLGDKSQTIPEFEVRNKRLKELCKEADKLDEQDQNIVINFLDMAVRQNKFKQIFADGVSP